MVKIGPLEFTMQTYTAEEVAKRHVEVPEPGRCADRIEDFFKVLAGGWNSSWSQHKEVFSTMVECLKSDSGDEPRDRYVLLTRDDPFWKDHEARPSKVARLKALEQQREQEAVKAQEQQQQLVQSQQQQQQQQQQQPQQLGHQQQQRRYSWLWWWRRTPQPLAAADAE